LSGFITGQDVFECSVHNKYLALILNSYGIKARRKIFEFETHKFVPADFMKHFIRGIIDGDGCISVNKHNNLRVDLCGNVEMLEFVKNFFSNSVEVPKVKTHQIKGTSQIGWGGSSAFKILNFLYGDSLIYLERKFKTFQNYRQTKKG
jgi:hypothetical protein